MAKINIEILTELLKSELCQSANKSAFNLSTNFKWIQ